MPTRIEYKKGDRVGECIYLMASPDRGKQRAAIFQCECGKGFECRIVNVKRGHTISCGCKSDAARIEIGRNNKTHGQSMPGAQYYSEFTIWATIKARCTRESDMNYPRYGGRGITICNEWLESFETFLEDMGPRPSKSHSIERNENDLGYFKGNCRWATRVEQANNRRTNRPITFQGQTLNLGQWAAKVGLRPPTLDKRLQRGIPLETALNTPSGQLR